MSPAGWAAIISNGHGRVDGAPDRCYRRRQSTSGRTFAKWPCATESPVFMPFSSLPGAIAAALADRGYEAPTSVQAEVLAAPAARDLVVSARTGSGKTVAYGLAIAHDLMGDAD